MFSKNFSDRLQQVLNCTWLSEIIIRAQLNRFATFRLSSLSREKMKGMVAVTEFWRSWLGHRNHRVPAS